MHWFLRQARIYAACLAGFCPRAACSTFPHNAFVKIDRFQCTVVIIVFLVDVRHVKLAEDIGTGSFNRITDDRSQSGSLDSLFDTSEPRSQS